MWILEYLLVLLVMFVTLCQSSPFVGIVPVKHEVTTPPGDPATTTAMPSVHAADSDKDYYEDLTFVFNDADHYENLGCDAYGYHYEDY